MCFIEASATIMAGGRVGSYMKTENVRKTESVPDAIHIARWRPDQHLGPLGTRPRERNTPSGSLETVSGKRDSSDRWGEFPPILITR